MSSDLKAGVTRVAFIVQKGNGAGAGEQPVKNHVAATPGLDSFFQSRSFLHSNGPSPKSKHQPPAPVSQQTRNVLSYCSKPLFDSPQSRKIGIPEILCEPQACRQPAAKLTDSLLR